MTDCLEHGKESGLNKSEKLENKVAKLIKGNKKIYFDALEYISLLGFFDKKQRKKLRTFKGVADFSYKFLRIGYLMGFENAVESVYESFLIKGSLSEFKEGLNKYLGSKAVLIEQEEHTLANYNKKYRTKNKK